MKELRAEHRGESMNTTIETQKVLDALKLAGECGLQSRDAEGFYNAAYSVITAITESCENANYPDNGEFEKLMLQVGAMKNVRCGSCDLLFPVKLPDALEHGHNEEGEPIGYCGCEDYPESQEEQEMQVAFGVRKLLM